MAIYIPNLSYDLTFTPPDAADHYVVGQWLPCSGYTSVSLLVSSDSEKTTFEIDFSTSDTTSVITPPLPDPPFTALTQDHKNFKVISVADGDNLLQDNVIRAPVTAKFVTIVVQLDGATTSYAKIQTFFFE